MNTTKTGLDDLILIMESHGLDVTDQIDSLIEAAPHYIPLADGADAYITKRSVEPTPQDILDFCAIKLNRSESEAIAFIESTTKGDAKRRALKKDVVARLAAIRAAQEPMPAWQIKASQDGRYAQFIKLLEDEPYVIDADGYLYRKIGYPPREKLQKISNFILRITREITVDDGNSDDPARFVEVTPIMAGGIELSAKTVPVVDFASIRNLLAQWGTRLIVEPGVGTEDYLRHSAQLLGRDVQRITRYNHTGWRKIDDRWVFLHAGKAIGISGAEVEMAEGSKAFAQYRFPDGDMDIVEAVRASLELLKVGPAAITIPLLAMCYTSVLLDLFRQAGISVGFSLFLVGKSGTFKSTFAALFLCHFGKFSKDILPGSFMSTANSLERLANTLKDLLLVVDDRYPTDNAKEHDAMTGTLLRMVRAVSNKSGRNRCNPDGSLRVSYPPRGLMIFTSELSVPGLSTNARGLELQFGEGQIDTAVLSHHQAQADKLAYAMRFFIEDVAVNFDATVEWIREQYSEARTLFSEGVEHKQLPEHLAALYIGLQAFLAFAEKVGAIDAAGAEAIRQEAKTILTGLGQHQSGEVRSEDSIELMDSILSELFASRQVYMKGIDGSAPPRAGQLGWSMQDEDCPVAPERATFLGWADAERYLFLPDILYAELVRFMSNQRRRFPLDQKALERRLRDAGRLITGNSQKRNYNRMRVKCEGEIRRVLVIRRHNPIELEPES